MSMTHQDLLEYADHNEIVLPRKDQHYGSLRAMCETLMRQGELYIAWKNKKFIAYRRLEPSKRGNR